MLLGTFAFYVKGRRVSVPASRDSERIGEQTKNLALESSKKQSPNGPRSNHSPQGPAKGKSQTKESPTAFNILLVEDDLVNQKVLSKQLRKSGCVVHVANHGQGALDFLETSDAWNGKPQGHALDVVLMDLEMPIMDGLTCAKRIRELQRLGVLARHVPLIAVTPTRAEGAD